MNRVLLRAVIPFIVIDDLGSGPSVAALSARECDASSMNELITLGRGPVRAILSPERADLFQLEAMNNRRASVVTFDSARGERYTASDAGLELVSVEARIGVHSGISAADRAATVAALGRESLMPGDVGPRDLVSPGHVFARRGALGGLVERADAYQGALEVSAQRLAKPEDAVVAVVELLANDGAVASAEEAAQLAQTRGYNFFSLTNLVRDKLLTSPLVSRVAESQLPLEGYAPFQAVLFVDRIFKREHLALVRGTPSSAEGSPVVRIHRKELFADVFGARLHGNVTPHGSRLNHGLARVASAQCGVFLYLDVVKATGRFEPMRDYAIGAQILVDLGIRHAHIVTDSAALLAGSTIFGVKITGQEALMGQDKGAIAV